MRTRTYVIGIISVLLFLTGATLKQLHLPGAAALIGIGLSTFAILFCPLFLYDKWTFEATRVARRSYLVLAISIEFVVFSSLFIILKLPGGSELAYLGIAFFTVYIVFFTQHTEGRKLKLSRSRQLTCVLFTDIVGFTQMMGEDEDSALIAIEKNRNIQKRLIRKYRGKWVKDLGDGSMVVFYTAYEAVQCAVEIQKKIIKETKFKVRMGLHISEIVLTDEDIFGDGVNVASRIASMAQADEIMFSEGVFQNIRNREDHEIEPLGPQTFKGVEYKVGVYKLKT